MSDAQSACEPSSLCTICVVECTREESLFTGMRPQPIADRSCHTTRPSSPLQQQLHAVSVVNGYLTKVEILVKATPLFTGLLPH